MEETILPTLGRVLFVPESTWNELAIRRRREGIFRYFLYGREDSGLNVLIQNQIPCGTTHWTIKDHRYTAVVIPEIYRDRVIELVADTAKLIRPMAQDD